MGLLVLVVLLLAIMPAMLYLLGWGVNRYTKKSRAWISLSATREEPTEKPDAETPARTEA